MKCARQNSEFLAEQRFFRCCFVVLGFCIVWKRQALDDLVSEFYQVCKKSPVFAHDSLEPVVASSAFALWIWLFYLFDTLNIFQQHRILPQQERELGWSSTSPKALAAYLIPILTYDFLFPRKVLPEAAPTFFGLVGSICLTIFVYDLLFFPVHLLLHNKKSLGWLGHSVHHSKTPLTSTEVIHHSFFDGSLQVLANIVSLRLCRAHPLARVGHNIVITYLLTELHAGYDCPWMLHNMLPQGLLGGPPAHEEHHRNGKKNFQQFFTYLDRLLEAYHQN